MALEAQYVPTIQSEDEMVVSQNAKYDNDAFTIKRCSNSLKNDIVICANPSDSIRSKNLIGIK